MRNPWKVTVGLGEQSLRFRSRKRAKAYAREAQLKTGRRHTVSKVANYGPGHVGCYVNGALGIYATDAIVGFAETHGMGDQTCDTTNHTHEETCDPSRFAGCEFASEIEDEATEFMNDAFPVDGATWGRNEQGDWGLWSLEEES